MRSGTDSAPPADAREVELLEVVRQFLQRFYRTATMKRKRDVTEQLGATLEPPGASLQKGIFVLAHSPERLVAKMREVMREGVKDDNAAIVVLLLKLGDTSDGSAPGVAAAADVKRDERASESDIAKAEAWINTHPELAAAIDEQLEREFSTAATGNTADFEMLRAGHRMARTALVVQAWRDRPPDAGPHT